MSTTSPPDVWLAEARDLHQSIAAAIPKGHAGAVERFLDTQPPPASDRLVFSHNDLGIERVLVDPSSFQSPA